MLKLVYTFRLTNVNRIFKKGEKLVKGRYKRQIKKYKKLFRKEQLKVLMENEEVFKTVYLLGLFDRFDILRK